MNMIIGIIIGILGTAIIAFVIIRNQKDKKTFENELLNDYKKPGNEEGDIEIDERTDKVH